MKFIQPAVLFDACPNIGVSISYFVLDKGYTLKNRILECGFSAAIYTNRIILTYPYQSIHQSGQTLVAVRMDAIDGFDVKAEPMNENSGLKAGTEINLSYALRSRVLPRRTAEPKVTLSQQVRNYDSKIPLVRGNP